MKLDYDALRASAEYAGLSDLQIECVFRRLDEASTEALIATLEERGIQVELHLFDRRYRS